MNSRIPSPPAQDWAQRLLAYEAAASSASGENTAVFRVVEKLRRPLCTLAGATGFRTLLARALLLAQAQVASLSAVRVQPDGSLTGLPEIDHEQATAGGVLLLAQLLGLLVTFLGAELTLRLVREGWPDWAVFGTELQKESEHDPTR